MIDNQDSFVHTLVGYLRELGARVRIVSATQADLTVLEAGEFDGLLISPGPGHPHRAGISIAAVRWAARTKIPLLGVCLGHQVIAVAFGGEVGTAAELMHGMVSSIRHDGTGVLHALPSPFDAGRYHSLAVLRVPAELEETAWSENGTLMGLRHRTLPIEGVQFHPESVLTEGGYLLLANWLEQCGAGRLTQRAQELSVRSGISSRNVAQLPSQ